MPRIWLSSAEDTEYESIQSAIDSASIGDTLYLGDGKYDLNEPLQIRQQIRICPAPDAAEQVSIIL
jgi:hypothetical protein